MLVSPKKSFETPQSRSPITPFLYSSPSCEDSGSCGRFIPNRTSSTLVNTFERCEEVLSPQKEEKVEAQRRFSGLLRCQLFGSDITNSESPAKGGSVYRYKTQLPVNPWMNKENIPLIPSAHDIPSLSASVNSRTLPKVPFKVLDAPQLPDDFYLNLLDWSASGVLAVGLNSTVYLWSAASETIIERLELPNECVSSVAWDQRGDFLAVGGSEGRVRLFDVSRGQVARVLGGHKSRAGVLAWSEEVLSSGSKDKSILHRDVRQREDFVARLTTHRLEVCGLKWSPDSQQLASGGNDNRVFTYSLHSPQPLNCFQTHCAAVKAVAWSPQQRGVLASGGGTADRTLRFWNTLCGTQIAMIDTGSQVCGVVFSRNSSEVASTHGYSQHQISVWKYPSLQKVGEFFGHTSRVLYLAMSPDGESLATGAGDETVRFWKAFPARQQSDLKSKFALSFRDMR